MEIGIIGYLTQLTQRIRVLDPSAPVRDRPNRLRAKQTQWGFGGCGRIGRLQISDFRSQISDFRSQISDFRSQISDFRSQISDFRFQISDLRLDPSRASGQAANGMRVASRPATAGRQEPVAGDGNGGRDAARPQARPTGYIRAAWAALVGSCRFCRRWGGNGARSRGSPSLGSKVGSTITQSGARARVGAAFVERA